VRGGHEEDEGDRQPVSPEADVGGVVRAGGELPDGAERHHTESEDDHLSESSADDESSGRVVRSALSGARAFAFSRIVIELLLFSSVIAIARLVSPTQQGHAAVGLVFPVIATILTFEGYGSALVAAEHPTADDYRTAMTMSIITGWVFGAAVFVTAETVARGIVGNETADLVAMTSPTFVIASTTCVSRSHMMRDLAFRRMSRNDVLTTVAGVSCSVFLAALGLGARALIYSAIFATVVDMVLQFSYFSPVRPGWSNTSARKILSFGSYAAAAGVLTTLLQNVDYLVLGVRFPARRVGIYYRAFAFGVQYQGKISGVLMKMIFPLMARSEDVAEMRRVRERAIEFNALAVLPLLGAIVVLAPTLVPLMYGDRWRAAVEPTQILAIAGMATALNAGSTGPALALGKTRLLAVMTGVMVVFYGGAIYLAAPYGLIVVCVTAAAAHTVMMLACQRYLVDKVIGLPVTQIFIDTGPAALVTAIAMGVGDLVYHLVVRHIPGALTVGAIATLILVTYLVGLRLIFPARSKRLLSVFRRVFLPKQKGTVGP
jgi:O-antigen/teichoic acid export membrane protein